MLLTAHTAQANTWSKRYSMVTHGGPARRDFVTAAIANSMLTSDACTLLQAPLGADGKRLDFRTSKRNQYLIKIFGHTFTVSKANGQPIYRLKTSPTSLPLYVQV